MRLICTVFTIAVSFTGFSAGAASSKDLPRSKPLLARTTTYISKSGTTRTVYEIKNEVLSGEGAMEASTFSIPLADPSIHFKLILARVSTDGQFYPVKPSEVLTSTTQVTKPGMPESRQLVIPFDKVKKGSIVEVTYQLDSPSPVPGVYETAALLPTNAFSEVEEFIYVSEKPLKFVKQGFGDAFTFKYSEAPGKYTVTIAATDTGRKLAGNFSGLTTVNLTTAESWRQINRTFTPKYEAAIKEELPAKFAALVVQAKELKSPADQIESVLRGLQASVTLSSDWRAAPSDYFPAGHAALLKRERGDAKDFAAAATAVLRQLGFSANAALTFRRSPFFTQKYMQEMAASANASYFNQALVWAKDSTGKIWWVDPTSPVVIADVLPSDLLGSYALVLDGKGSELQTLPLKNAEPSTLALTQVIKIKPDLSVEVEGTLIANPSANNMMAVIERTGGADALKRMFGQMIFKEMPSALDFKVSKAGNVSTYTLRSVALNWVRERTGMSRHVPVPSPLRLSMAGKEGREDYDFGQTLDEVAVTTIKGQSAVDPVEQDCLVRSRWLDFDRKVSLKGKDTEVRDHLMIKDRWVTGEQFKSEEFKSVFADAAKCDATTSILTFEPPPRAEEAAKLLTLKGPALDKMTDSDAEKLAESRNIPMHDYLLKKLHRYYLGKIEKDAKDLAAYAKISAVLTEMGYLSGNDFNAGYVNAAMAFVDQGLALAGDAFNAPLIHQRSILFSHLGKQAEAARDFTLLNQKEPNSFDTAMLGYHLNLLRKNHSESEKWLAHAARKATTPAQKRLAATKLAFLYSDQGKHSEALAKLTLMLKDPEASAWDWHNAAREHLLLNEYDKCIELEKKALALTDFAAARELLVDALTAKAKEKTAKNGATSEETLALRDEAEALLLEALKWKAQDLQVHLALIDLRLDRYSLTRKPEDFEKAKAFIERTTKLQAGSAELVKRMDMLQAISQSKPTHAARVPTGQ